MSAKSRGELYTTKMGWDGFFNYLRKVWLVHGLQWSYSYPVAWTGYTKETGGSMNFIRPVGAAFPISAHFGDWATCWSKHMNPSGLWISGQVEGKGQHKGIDFAVPEGTMVTAMCDGLVVMAGWENPANVKQGFGQRVRQQIMSDGGVVRTVVYGHLSLIYARNGQKLAKGDRIGLSGKTGHVTGPHLHVELVDANQQYYPITFDA